MAQRILPKKYTARLTVKELVSPQIYLGRFEYIDPPTLDFRPGHTIMLYIAPGINRSMSIASPPSEKDSLTLCYNVAPMGPGSRWMISLKEGDIIQFMAPLGIFLLDEESHKKKVFVATGTGVAPFRSMLRHYLEKGGTDDCTLYWGMRYETEVFWQQEFAQLTHMYPNFRFVLTISKPTPAWDGKKGRVTDHLFVDEVNLAGSDFYLCGSGAMVDDVRNELLKREVPDAQIKRELFFQ